MAASMKKKVHVEYESSDSGSEGDFEESDDGLDADPIGLDDNESTGKSGLADVMAKILQKKVPVHQQVILAKGKTDKEIRKRKQEVEEADKPEGKKKAKKMTKTPGPITTAHMAHQEKLKQWENMARVKPDPLQRDKERQFQRIATRGVVQLFNAVRKQQKVLEEEIDHRGTSERRKDKVIQSMTKDKFMDILKGSSNVKVDPSKVKDVKTVRADTGDDAGDQDKKWTILRDDYMMGAKMKDWNVEGSDEEEGPGPGDPDMSDSE